MDPNATLIALCEAIRDRDREKCWDALEALNDWLAKGGPWPDEVRAVPMTDTDILLASVGLLELIEVAKKGLCPIPGLDAQAQNQLALLGAKFAMFLEDEESIVLLNQAMKAYAGLDPNNPL